MEAARFSCARFDNEDILYVCQYMIYRPLYYVSQARGYLASHANSDSNVSSKLILLVFPPILFSMMILSLVSLPILIVLSAQARRSCIP